MNLERRIALATAAAVAAGGVLLIADKAQAASHPRIRQAIGALQNARYDLVHAAHDFGGHKNDAIAAVDHAIEQLNICLGYP